MNPLLIRGCIILATAAFAWGLTKLLPKGNAKNATDSGKPATPPNDEATKRDTSGGSGGGSGDTSIGADSSAVVEPSEKTRKPHNDPPDQSLG